MPGLTGRTERKRVGRTPAPRPLTKGQKLAVPEAPVAAPEVYKVILENPAVQVTYVYLRQGETAPMHSHPHDYVAYVLSPCRVRFTSRDGQREEVEMRTGDVQWHEAEAHQTENIGKSECQAVLFAIKNVRAMRFLEELKEPDAVVAAPEQHRVILENQEVRVSDVRIGKGTVVPMHSHQGPYLVYPLSPARVRFTAPDGSVTEQEIKTGDVRWLEAGAHQVENLSDTESHVLVVEMKKGILAETVRR